MLFLSFKNLLVKVNKCYWVLSFEFCFLKFWLVFLPSENVNSTSVRIWHTYVTHMNAFMYYRILQLRNTIFKTFANIWLFPLQLRCRCDVTDTSLNAVSVVGWPQLSTQTPFSHCLTPSQAGWGRIKVRKNSWVKINTLVSKGEGWGEEEKKRSHAKIQP